MKSMIKKTGLSIKEGSNKTCIKGSLYVTAGEKCKVIGWQDGMFYDFGHHVADEMGGIWIHPIKIADGYWLKLNGEFLKADEYETLPYGNKFKTNLGNDLTVTRFQFSPDKINGVSIKYTIKNNSHEDKKINLEFVTRFDILPVWFSEESQILNFDDTALFDDKNECIVCKDDGHEWYGVLSSSFPINSTNIIITKNHIGACETFGKGISASISNDFVIKANESKEVIFYLTGSYVSKQNAIDDLICFKQNEIQLFDDKINRYKEIRNKSLLSTNDKDFDQTFEWIKYNVDWLIADCGDYGRGLTAGLAEYPWWFGCDNCYSVQGLLAIGEFELARATLCLVKEYSEKNNGNGRIVHEITTNGKIANPGNTQETAHFITAVFHYLKWTGDIETIKSLYDYCVKGINWLFDEMDNDKDLLPSGYGIIEITGLNVELIDTAVYSCQALFNMDTMSTLLGFENKDYLIKANKLKDIINSNLWNEKEGLFVDCVATPKQILSRIERMFQDEKLIISDEYKSYLNELKNTMNTLPQNQDYPIIINKNWVINTPMETMIADKDKAIVALEKMRENNFTGEYGTYLSGFMNKDSMTISTGVQAVSEGRYKQCDNSLELLNKMFKTFSMRLPGSMNEMSPDYGCFVQAWTAYSAFVPVIECFAGLKPVAYENKLVIEPCIPSKWTQMKLTNIKIGYNTIDFVYEKLNESKKYYITSTHEYDILFVADKSASKIFVNGELCNGEIKIGMGTSIIEIFE